MPDWRLVFRLITLLIACSLGLRADVADELNRTWKGNTLTLRVADSARKISFNANGERIGKQSDGLWATDTVIQVNSVRVRGRQLQIEGKRVINRFNAQKGKFERFLTRNDVTVELELAERAVTSAQLMPTLAKVFVTDSQDPSAMAPYYWKACLEGGVVQEVVQGRSDWRCRVNPELSSSDKDKAPKEFPGFGLVYRVNLSAPGIKVSPPKALSTPDPAYPEFARQMKYQGTTILWLIVDREGKPRNILVVRPLGYGLDDAAVRSVETWRFKPAMKDGVPVPVQINVEVNFRLY